MSVASEFEIQRQLITNAYNKLDDLGIDLSNVDKNIDNIAEMLDTVYEEYPKVTGQGTEVTLDGTKAGKLSLDIKGNSTQETTTGKNKVKLPDVAQKTLNGLTFSVQDDVVTIDGSATALTTICETTLFNIPVGTNSFEIVPISGTWTSGTLGLRGYTSTSSQKWYTQVAYNYNPKKVSKEYTEDELSVTARVNFYSTATGVFSNYKFKVMVIEGSTYDSTFEEYTGGIASPNPSYSQPILSAGDNGTISEKIVNKNLYNGLDNKKISLSGVSSSTNVTTSGITTSGKGVWGNCSLLFQFKKNTDYVVSFKELDILSHKAGISIYGTNVLNYVNTDLTTIISNVVDITANQIANVSTTFNSGNYDYILFRFWNNGSGTTLSDTSNLQISEIQLELGSTATTYVAHQEQTYTIPVQQPMRSIGDVRDEFIKVNGEWKERHNIERIELTGNENFTNGGTVGTDYRYNKTLSSLNLPGATSNNALCLSDKFRNTSIDTSRTWGAFYVNGNWLVFYDKDKNFETASEFNTWLSTHNTEIIYVLATPVDLPCTEEQIAILENLPKSYNEQTNIYSLDVTPAYIEAQALKGE